MILLLKLKTKTKYTLHIRVADAYRPNTLFTDREGPVEGERTFYIRMPQTPRRLVCDIYAPGKDPNADDPNFELVEKDILDIETFPREYDSVDPLLQSAVKFIQAFSMRAGTLSTGAAGSVYMSDDGRFRIDYLPVIVDRQKTIAPDPNHQEIRVTNPNYGRELTTPARISQDRGVIEVSQKYFLPIPTTQREPILFHEVSHFYFNKNHDDEQEADERAIKMALGLGYSDTDVYDAFNNVFINAPSDENVERDKKLMDQIMDFGERNYRYK